MNRAEYPHAPLDSRATVRLADGTEVELPTIDVSRVGIQLEAAEAIRSQLFPSHRFAWHRPPAPGERPSVSLRIAVPTACTHANADSPPDGDQEAGEPVNNIEAEAEAVIFRRVGQNRYRIGLHFTAFRGDSANVLYRYVYTQARR